MYPTKAGEELVKVGGIVPIVGAELEGGKVATPSPIKAGSGKDSTDGDFETSVKDQPNPK
jgi:hypothetical protein